MMTARRRLLAALAVPGLAGPLAWAQEVSDYRYRDNGWTGKREHYQTRLLALALEKTLATHGPYRLTRVVDTLTPRRLLQEMNDGKRINVFVGHARTEGPGIALNEQLPVAFSILDKLPGFRSLIIRRDDLARFAELRTVEQLKQLRAGQGHEWVDARILRHNGFRVDDSGNLDRLLPMLSNKRFDYLPMSIIEAESLLQRHRERTHATSDELMIAPTIAIQYPLQAFFYVSRKFPIMAARLELGLTRAKTDGSFDALLRSSFRSELRTVAEQHPRHFAIVNPFLSTS